MEVLSRLKVRPRRRVDNPKRQESLQLRTLEFAVSIWQWCEDFGVHGVSISEMCRRLPYTVPTVRSHLELMLREGYVVKARGEVEDSLGRKRPQVIYRLSPRMSSELPNLIVEWSKRYPERFGLMTEQEVGRRLKGHSDERIGLY
jgi:DNA-binding transcriptional ArsR family regulator